MLFAFTVIGLIAYFTGELPMARNPSWRNYHLEREAVRKLGVVLIIIDLIPIFLLILAAFPSMLPQEWAGKMMNISVFSMFISPMINILIINFSFIAFSKRDED